MCTIDEIMERLKDLPEVPNCLMSFATPEVFHGVVNWIVKKGSMMSFLLFDHPNGEMYHTKFSKNTELQWHNHGDESEELIFCMEGRITIIFQDGSKITLNEKEKCVIGKQIQHTAIVGDKPCQILALTIPKEKR